jgi:hypothetical protein
LTALYKALGGGWEIRAGESFVSPEDAEQMRARTRWGDLLEADAQAEDARRVGSASENRHWWDVLW